MKKTAVTLGIISLCSSFASQADTILGLYAGAQGWYMQSDGGFSQNAEEDIVTFNFDDKAKSNIYVAFEHPIPLIPNIKLQKTAMGTEGNATLNSNFNFGDETFFAGTELNTDIQLTATDIILYYEFFDNDLISFDFGINAKYIDGEFLVFDKEDPTRNGQQEFSGPVPMLYSRLAVGLPFTGFGAYVEGSYLSIDDNTLTDYQAAVTYSLMENLALDVTFQAGYRSVSLQLEDLDDIYSDLKFKGAFAGIEVHF